MPREPVQRTESTVLRVAVCLGAGGLGVMGHAQWRRTRQKEKKGAGGVERELLCLVSGAKGKLGAEGEADVR